MTEEKGEKLKRLQKWRGSSYHIHWRSATVILENFLLLVVGNFAVSYSLTDICVFLITSLPFFIHLWKQFETLLIYWSKLQVVP